MKMRYFLFCLATAALSGPAIAGSNILPGSGATVTGSSIHAGFNATIAAIGFAGLAFAGYRTSRKGVSIAA